MPHTGRTRRRYWQRTNRKYTWGWGRLDLYIDKKIPTQFNNLDLIGIIQRRRACVDPVRLARAFLSIASRTER